MEAHLVCTQTWLSPDVDFTTSVATRFLVTIARNFLGSEEV